MKLDSYNKLKKNKREPQNHSGSVVTKARNELLGVLVSQKVVPKKQYELLPLLNDAIKIESGGTPRYT